MSEKFRLRHSRRRRQRRGFVILHSDGRPPTIVLPDGRTTTIENPLPNGYRHLNRLARKANLKGNHRDCHQRAA